MAKKNLSRQKKFDTRIDFTPMVDMNMLLITFFMLCTTMIKSQTLQIALPTNEKVEQENQNKVKESEALTIIIDGKEEKKVVNGDTVYTAQSTGKVLYYEGKPDEAELKEVTLAKGEGTLRAVLRDKNKEVIKAIEELKTKWRNNEISDSVFQLEASKARNNDAFKRPVVMIKATPSASYKDVVVVLDEMQINGISRYQLEHVNHEDSVLMQKFASGH